MDQESLPLFRAIGKWPRVSLYCLALAFNILLWGYDSAIISNVASMPVYQQVFGEQFGDSYIISSEWLALWSVALPIGSMIGAVAGGWIQDLTGRKVALAIGSVISIVAIAICYVADLTGSKNVTFFGGKLVEGIAVGVIMCSTQTYMSEVVPTRLRGPVLAFFPAFQLLGQLLAAIVVFAELGVPGKTSYRVAIASEWPFSVVPLVLAVILPESPVWLLQKDRTGAARDTFRKLHGAMVASENQDLFDDMNKAVSEERYASHARNATYFECFRGTNLRRTLIVIFTNTIPELFGLTLLGHVSYFLQLIGLSHATSIIVLILGVVLGLIANGVSFSTLSKFGRRPLILITMIVVSVLWGSIGISGCFKSIAVAWYTTAGIMAVVVSAGIGVWPASYVVASETSSLRLRSKTQGVGWLMGGVARCAFGISVPYLYNLDAAALGAKTGFIFFGTTAIGVFVSWLIIPEMKGLTPVMIDHLFEMRLPVRRSSTPEWNSAGDAEDGVPLRDRDTGSDTIEYDATTPAIDITQPLKSSDGPMPFRKRPTF